jgi:hypothetical protein
MGELRQQVADAIRDYERETHAPFVVGPTDRLLIADKILAIPRIKLLLQLVDVGASGLETPDGKPMALKTWLEYHGV